MPNPQIAGPLLEYAFNSPGGAILSSIVQIQVARKSLNVECVSSWAFLVVVKGAVFKIATRHFPNQECSIRRLKLPKTYWIEYSAATDIILKPLSRLEDNCMVVRSWREITVHATLILRLECDLKVTKIWFVRTIIVLAHHKIKSVDGGRSLWW